MKKSCKKKGIVRSVGIIEEIIHNCTVIYSQETAIQYGENKLSYASLLGTAKTIAAYITINSANDGPIGFICSKNMNFIPAWLGGILSGKVVFQIDDSWPLSRAAEIVKLVGCQLLINTTNADCCRWNSQCGVPVHEWSDIVRTQGADNITLSTIDYEKPAYLLFTSGTTGRPKAVINNLRSINHFFQWYLMQYSFDCNDVFSMLSGIAHDPIIRDMLTPLLVGGRISIPTSDDLSSPSRLSAYVLGNDISTVHLTPPMGKVLFQISNNNYSNSKLRNILFGGASLPIDLAEKCVEKIPEAQVANFYGATETPQVMLYNDLNFASLKYYRKIGLSKVPIGKPIPDVAVFLERSDGNLCQQGEEGQINLVSDYLSLGYFQGDQTNKLGKECKFSKGKAYKTGDLGVLLANGEMNALGREDRQIKIRGYRVEPAEIEIAIRRLGEVDDVVVTKDQENEKLDVFVVCVDSTLNVSIVNTHLRKYLPPYIQVNNIYIIESIRLSGNGKINYNYLKMCKLNAEQKVLDCKITGQNSTVLKLVNIFRETLNVEGIVQSDKLLDIGCDSLKSYEIVEIINQKLGIQLSTVDLYECQTAEALAKFIETGHDVETLDYWKADDFKKKLVLTTQPGPCRFMQSDILCQFLFSKLYVVLKRQKLRWLLETMILKREGGAWFTTTLRELYQEQYGVSIGSYSSFCFNVANFKRKTVFGRYCDVTRTARFETANHPSNTLSVHGIFYQKALGFSKGVEIPRNRIVVGNDVHIGHNASFLYPGKEIGDGAIIGANTVVNFDVPPYAIVAGNPGKVVRYRFDKQTIKELLRLKWWNYDLEMLEVVKTDFIKPLVGKKVI